MQQIVDVLREAEEEYVPSGAVCEALSKVTMVPLVGPFAVGKSACMDEVRGIDPGFGRVQSFTTREPRAGEEPSEYRWLKHDPTNLDRILGWVRRGELVQYVIHPTTGNVYGSDLSDFARPYTMLDALSNSIAPLRALPFKDMVEITLVVEPCEWEALSRVRKEQVDKAELEKRLREGVKSLTWSLEQGDDMAWVANQRGALRKTAEEIIGITKRLREPSQFNREVGERLLRHIEAVLG